MPALNGTSKEQQQLAIPMSNAVASGDGTAGPSMPQPRQPQNLQGLLRFAMEAQTAEEQRQPAQQQAAAAAARPLDEETRRFLNDALKSMTVDVTAVMKENIRILAEEDITDDEVPKAIAAFETILDYADNIDVANDFNELNGFVTFKPCLTSKHPAIRLHMCELVAVLTQNNPRMQHLICEVTNALNMLLSILAKDDDGDVRVKALYAISCITRQSDFAYRKFKESNGIDAMKSLLEVANANDKLRTKAAFLLSALVPLDENLTGELLDKDFLTIIVNALAMEHQSSHEHLVSLLRLIVLNEKSRQRVVQDGGVEELKMALTRNLQFVVGKEEFLEEQECYEQILRLVSTL